MDALHGLSVDLHLRTRIAASGEKCSAVYSLSGYPAPTVTFTLDLKGKGSVDEGRMKPSRRGKLH